MTTDPADAYIDGLINRLHANGAAVSLEAASVLRMQHDHVNAMEAEVNRLVAAVEQRMRGLGER